MKLESVLSAEKGKIFCITAGFDRKSKLYKIFTSVLSVSFTPDVQGTIKRISICLKKHELYHSSDDTDLLQRVNQLKDLAFESECKLEGIEAVKPQWRGYVDYHMMPRLTA